MKFEREIPVHKNVDVCIIGGGPSGCAAAVYAARAGASVYLAEAGGCFGGLGTIGLVDAFMRFTDGVNFNADGFGREIGDAHLAETGVGPYKNRHGSFVIQVETLKRIYDRLVTEAGVDYTFNTRAIAVEAEEGTVHQVIFTAPNKIGQNLFAVEAKIFIDCTGDGDICVWSGAAYQVGEGKQHEVMPGTLCSLWRDVDWERVPNGQVHALLEQAIKDGFFEKPDLHLPGVSALSGNMGGGNVGHAFNLDGLDARSITKALVEQRKELLIWQAFYNKYVPGFEKAQMFYTADMMGVRESRRIECEYMLNADDFRARAVFDDEIGRYSYPVDIHRKSDNAETYAVFLQEYMKDMKYEDGESYGIPYRILLPKATNNLLVAGRCVGCDRAIQASIRVMPGCYITGQAAGAAAALSIKNGVALRQLPVDELQGFLKAQGAYLPNYKA